MDSQDTQQPGSPSMFMALEEALMLANLAIPVLPLCAYNHQGDIAKHKSYCNRPGKAPLIKEWMVNSTTDLKKLTAWFKNRPNANVGALLGKRSGIVAIDVDGDFGRQKLNELAEGDLPSTWEFETPGDGYRYLFRAPDGYTFTKLTISNPNSEHEELALLGEGQYTVMPGSVHANGTPYVWKEHHSPFDLPIADAPEWMLCKMSTSYNTDRFYDNETSVVQDVTKSEVDDYSIPTFASTSTSTSTSKPTSSLESSSESSSISTLISESTDMHSNMNTDNSISTNQLLTLNVLAKGCAKINQALDTQKSGGCDEDTWFKISSLLCRVGKSDEAITFSELSSKHNNSSNLRISKVIKDANQKAFGPVRCTSLGCGDEQIKICFGETNTNKGGVFINSPSWLLNKKGSLKVKKPASLNQVPSNLDDLVARTNYRIDKCKVGKMTYNKDGGKSFEPIANFLAIPVLDISLDNGSDVERMFEFECIMLANGHRLPPKRVKHSDFADLKWITQWGLLPNLEPGNVNREKMRHLIQQLAVNVEQKQVFTHLGYRKIGDHWRYLHADGCIGEPGIQVEVDRRLAKYVLPDGSHDIKAALRQSLSLLDIADQKITLPMLATIFLAPLCETLRTAGIEPSFLLWLHGQTGTQKSTLAALFLCHYGAFSPKGPPASFKDTSNPWNDELSTPRIRCSGWTISIPQTASQRHEGWSRSLNPNFADTEIALAGAG